MKHIKVVPFRPETPFEDLEGIVGWAETGDNEETTICIGTAPSCPEKTLTTTLLHEMGHIELRHVGKNRRTSFKGGLLIREVEAWLWAIQRGNLDAIDLDQMESALNSYNYYPDKLEISALIGSICDIFRGVQAKENK